MSYINLVDGGAADAETGIDRPIDSSLSDFRLEYQWRWPGSWIRSLIRAFVLGYHLALFDDIQSLENVLI